MFFLFQAICVSIWSYFIKELFDKFEISNIFGMILNEHFSCFFFIFVIFGFLQCCKCFLEEVNTELIVEIDESHDVWTIGVELRGDITWIGDCVWLWTCLGLLDVLEILILATDVRGIVGSLAGIGFILLFLCKFFGFIHFLVLVMRIVLVVGHGVVDIDALVIEQLRERNHGGVLEIFAKASGN